MQDITNYKFTWDGTTFQTMDEYWNSLICIKDIDFIEMCDLQGVYDQIYAIGEGWA